MIKFLVMDVDGTLTDGKVYMGNDGEVCKAFDIKDGYAIKCQLPSLNIIPVVITARTSEIVANRCSELNITECHQGISAKYDKLLDILNTYSKRDGVEYNLSNVAYVGDDLLDLQCMQPVKSNGGLVACPQNAAKEVQLCSNFIATSRGGEGAVREFVEWLLVKDALKPISFANKQSAIDKYVDFILKLDKSKLSAGHYEVDDHFCYNVQEYEAFDKDECCYESHRKHIDIQYLISGCEKMLVTDIHNLKSIDEYNIEKDVIHYATSENESGTILFPGSCLILFPKDAHKPEKYGNNKTKIRKIVGKVKM